MLTMEEAILDRQVGERHSAKRPRRESVRLKPAFERVPEAAAKGGAHRSSLK
jgi:hypothetical protein